MRPLTVLGIALSLALATTIVAQTADNPPLADRLNAATEVREFRFEVAADADTVRFTVENRIRRGRVEWRLVDPAGRQRLSIHGTRGRVSGNAGALQAIAGTWTARARFARATAEYAVAWTVRP